MYLEAVLPTHVRHFRFLLCSCVLTWFVFVITMDDAGFDARIDELLDNRTPEATLYEYDMLNLKYITFNSL